MEPLRKIPLEKFIQILQELYDGGADFVDISGQVDEDGVQRDTIKIAVMPEYVSNIDEDESLIEERFDINSLEKKDSLNFSDDDINELI
jgi:hypothetical protein